MQMKIMATSTVPLLNDVIEYMLINFRINGSLRMTRRPAINPLCARIMNSSTELRIDTDAPEEGWKATRFYAHYATNIEKQHLLISRSCLVRFRQSKQTNDKEKEV